MPESDAVVDRADCTIGGRKFYQRPVTLGQSRLLLRRFKGYPLFSMQLSDLMGLMADQVSAILAIVLIEEGQTVEQKMQRGEAGLAELAAWLDALEDPGEVSQALTHFFVLKQLERALRMMPKVTAQNS